MTLQVKNRGDLPIEEILKQMNELRPLPLGRSEFDAWSERIYSGLCFEVDIQSVKFALANMLLSLGPTEDHKSDMHFIKSLRKFAVNQIADAVRTEIREKIKGEKQNDLSDAVPDA